MTRLQGALLLAAAALASPALAARQLNVRTHAPAAKKASSADVVSSNVLSLRKGSKAAKSKSYLSSLRSSVVAASNYSYGATPLDNLESVEYVAQIEWDGVAVEVIVDSGSSDTWLVQAGFTCVDEDGNQQTVCLLKLCTIH